MKLILSAICLLIFMGCDAEEYDVGDSHIIVWRDPATAQDYLIVTRSCNYNNGHGGGTSISVAITPRLPAITAPPADPMRDDTYEYAITQTAWTPVNGWERVGVIDGTSSRYRRRLDYVRMHLEKAP